MLFLSACAVAGLEAVPPTLTPEHIPPQAATQAPTPTLPTPLALLWADPESDSQLLAQVQAVVAGQTQDAGLRLETRQALTRADLEEHLRLVIALPTAPGLSDLIAAAPGTQFIAINVQGLAPSGNLTTIGGEGVPPDFRGFIAGYISALITDDYRVGVLNASDTVEGQEARRGFLLGVPYFCGLCRQLFPPFYQYPLYAEAPLNSPADQWRAAADLLLASAVETIYVAPGVGDAALLEYLALSGVRLIGSETPPEELRRFWVATVKPDHVAALEVALPRVLAGESLGEVAVPLLVVDLNAEYLSLGKQAHVQEILADLMAGYINTQSP